MSQNLTQVLSANTYGWVYILVAGNEYSEHVWEFDLQTVISASIKSDQMQACKYKASAHYSVCRYPKYMLKRVWCSIRLCSTRGIPGFSGSSSTSSNCASLLQTLQNCRRVFIKDGKLWSALGVCKAFLAASRVHTGHLSSV